MMNNLDTLTSPMISKHVNSLPSIVGLSPRQKFIILVVFIILILGVLAYGIYVAVKNSHNSSAASSDTARGKSCHNCNIGAQVDSIGTSTGAVTHIGAGTGTVTHIGAGTGTESTPDHDHYQNDDDAFPVYQDHFVNFDPSSLRPDHHFNADTAELQHDDYDILNDISVAASPAASIQMFGDLLTPIDSETKLSKSHDKLLREYPSVY